MLEASLTAGTPDVTAFAALIVAHTAREQQCLFDNRPRLKILPSLCEIRELNTYVRNIRQIIQPDTL